MAKKAQLKLSYIVYCPHYVPGASKDCIQAKTLRKATVLAQKMGHGSAIVQLRTDVNKQKISMGATGKEWEWIDNSKRHNKLMKQQFEEGEVVELVPDSDGYYGGYLSIVSNFGIFKSAKSDKLGLNVVEVIVESSGGVEKTEYLFFTNELRKI